MLQTDFCFHPTACGQFVLLTDFGTEINLYLIQQSDSYRETRSPQRDDPLRGILKRRLTCLSFFSLISIYFKKLYL